MSLIDSYGFTGFCAGMPDTRSDPGYGLDGLVPARICEVQRDRYTIVTDGGFRTARIKKGEFRLASDAAELPAVGDFVLAKPNPDGEDQIYRVLPRKSSFSRLNPTPGAGEQIVAANFDIVLVVTSLNQDFNVRRLERYLAATRQSGARPVIVLTKADLCADPEPFLSALARIAPNADALVLSALTGAGMDRLAALLEPGITAVLLGSSGAGKSSLVNALTGTERMKTNAIREDDARGRHTTTHRELILLDSGALLIDTPGMRVLGLWDAEECIDGIFPEIEALASRCRFSDCGHGAEPGCAIRTALEDGSLDPKRWAQYLKLGKEAAYTEDPAAYAHRKRETNKDIAKWSKTLQKGRRDEW